MASELFFCKYSYFHLFQGIKDEVVVGGAVLLVLPPQDGGAAAAAAASAARSAAAAVVVVVLFASGSVPQHPVLVRPVGEALGVPVDGAGDLQLQRNKTAV